MKTQANKISYLRKNITLFFMLVLLISLLWAKHIRAQSTLWVENVETSERKFFILNKPISYKLVTSKHFHNGRLTSFTDSTLTIQINGKEFINIRIKDLAAVKKRSEGRAVAGSILIVFGTIAGFSAIISRGGWNDSQTDNHAQHQFVVAGLTAIPAGIICMSREKIDLKQSWVLKTK